MKYSVTKALTDSYSGRLEREKPRLQVEALSVYDRDEAREQAVLIAWQGEEPRPSAPFGVSPTGEVAQTGKGITVEMTHSRQKYQSQIFVPIKHQTDFLGVLTSASYEAGFFKKPEHVAKIEALAGQLAAVWNQPNQELAIELDDSIESLSQENPEFDWSGIYRIKGDDLILTAFRGAATPHMIIPKTKGICGAAVLENKTLNIEDVKSDPRYLSCDIRTRSELVVPIRNKEGNPIGEIDIDSHRPQAFNHEKIQLVEKLAEQLAPILSKF